MADPSPVLTPQGTEDNGAYRPISALAIAGLALSALYAVLLVITTIPAWIQGTPSIIPGRLIPLAIFGAVLSLLAMWQIRRAEGTRAGFKVAQWGFWLSLVSGLGYLLCYDMPTGFAIRGQANRFLTAAGDDAGFLPLLKKGERNAAFLLTQTYARRSSSNPRDDEAMRQQFDSPMGQNPTGYLSEFLGNNFIRVLQQAHLEGGPIEWEPADGGNWQFTKGYKVVRNYRITTPEAAMDVVMTVQSTDNAGEGRKWFVVMPETGYRTIDYTPAGRKMLELRLRSREFVDAWLQHLSKGRLAQAFLETLEPQKREAAERAAALREAALALTFPNNNAGIFSWGTTLAFWPGSELTRRLCLPDFAGFASGSSFLKAEIFGMPKGAPEKELRAAFKRIFLEEAASTLPFGVKLDEYKTVLWELTDPHLLRISHAFQVNLVGDVEGKSFRFMGKGRLVVETAVTGDPRTTEVAPQWRVVEVTLDRALPYPRGKN